jgi:hypothetical protein
VVVWNSELQLACAYRIIGCMIGYRRIVTTLGAPARQAAPRSGARRFGRAGFGSIDRRGRIYRLSSKHNARRYRRHIRDYGGCRCEPTKKHSLADCNGLDSHVARHDRALRYSATSSNNVYAHFFVDYDSMQGSGQLEVSMLVSHATEVAINRHGAEQVGHCRVVRNELSTKLKATLTDCSLQATSKFMLPLALASRSDERGPNWSRRHGVYANAFLCQHLSETSGEVLNGTFRGRIGEQDRVRPRCFIWPKPPLGA